MHRTGTSYLACVNKWRHIHRIRHGSAGGVVGSKHTNTQTHTVSDKRQQVLRLSQPDAGHIHTN